MKTLTIVSALAILCCTTLTFAAADKPLRITKAGCIQSTTWESEARCFRFAVDGIINEINPKALLRGMCEPMKTWESEAKCYRGAADASGIEPLLVIKNGCSKVSSWEGEAKCFRSHLSR